MDLKTQKELEKAKALFYEWRLLDAYNIFRRYYDRLPFKPETGHADYIGYFVRILLELGKEYELKFYLSELEKLNSSMKSLELSYQLANIYAVGPEKNYKAAKTILEQVVAKSSDLKLVARAKVFLAYCYDSASQDIAACRRLIDSIEDPPDEETKCIVDIWRAKVFRDEKRYSEAEQVLNGLFKVLTPNSNWYCYFSAKNIQAILYIRTGKLDKAVAIVDELKKIFEGKKFTSIKVNLAILEKELDKHRNLGMVSVCQSDKEFALKYADKTLKLQNKSAAEKLLLHLAKKGFLDRTMIVKLLYNRQYDSGADDKLVYYHIHSLRKVLKKVGLPPEAISLEEDGYRLVPEVQFLEAEL